MRRRQTTRKREILELKVIPIGGLNEIGKKLEEEYSVQYLYSDFKKKDGYKSSIRLSSEYNLYRQDYCGCIFSKKQREQEKQQKEQQ